MVFDGDQTGGIIPGVGICHDGRKEQSKFEFFQSGRAACKIRACPFSGITWDGLSHSFFRMLTCSGSVNCKRTIHLQRYGDLHSANASKPLIRLHSYAPLRTEIARLIRGKDPRYGSPVTFGAYQRSRPGETRGRLPPHLPCCIALSVSRVFVLLVSLSHTLSNPSRSLQLSTSTTRNNSHSFT